jgi:hypothetical protein
MCGPETDEKWNDDRSGINNNVLWARTASVDSRAVGRDSNANAPIFKPLTLRAQGPASSLIFYSFRRLVSYWSGHERPSREVRLLFFPLFDAWGLTGAGFGWILRGDRLGLSDKDCCLRGIHIPTGASQFWSFARLGGRLYQLAEWNGHTHRASRSSQSLALWPVPDGMEAMPPPPDRYRAPFSPLSPPLSPHGPVSAVSPVHVPRDGTAIAPLRSVIRSTNETSIFRKS